MAKAEGRVDERFSKLRDALASCHADGLMQGGGVAVVLDGKPIAELWCGYADAAKTRLWQQNTLVNVWSCTKAVVATAVAMAVDRGVLRYDAPLAKVWPEFAANGKEAVTLDVVMSHRAGLQGFADPVDEDLIFDWTRATKRLAAQKPFSEPGMVCVYHGLTYGWLAGEALRRATGKTVGEFIASDIAAPLRAEFYVGVPQAQDDRCAEMIAGSGCNDWVANVLASPYPQSCKNPTPDASWANWRRWRAAEVPGGNGHGTVAGLAAIMGDLARAKPSLLSETAIGEASRVRFKGLDQGFQSETCWAAGFRRGRNDEVFRVSDATLSHGGWGGSICFADTQARLGFAFVTNHMLGFDDGIDPRRQRLISAVYDAL